VLVHPAKFVKVALGRENPQAATEHLSLCQGPSRGMSSCIAPAELVPTA
jgi:hypothetical protein